VGSGRARVAVESEGWRTIPPVESERGCDGCESRERVESERSASADPPRSMGLVTCRVRC
jgi:hypothetical protein